MLLHTLSNASNRATVADCLRIASAGDAVLLMDDGVYLAREKNSDLYAMLEKEIAMYALKDDCLGRGIVADAQVTLVDMAGFVELTERFDRQMAWS